MTLPVSSSDLATDVVDGQTVEGTYNSDGSFVSADGTIYVTPGGQVEHGLTDLATGAFLENGVVRTINGVKVYGVVQDGIFFYENGTQAQLPNGNVVGVKTLPNNTVLFSYVIGGQTVWGTYNTDGSFLSADGTIYVTPDGQVQHGITDPVTGEFLQNGVVRTINGVKVYGTVQDGIFYDEDDDEAQLPSGKEVGVKILPDDTVLLSYVILGQTIWGTYNSDGSFENEDGTIYVTSDGEVQYGKTDPVTGVFLQNGEVRIIDGVEVYGTVQDGIFFYEDGTQAQLPNGDVVGVKVLPDDTVLLSYVIGGQTIWGNYNSDGSFENEDGTIYVTSDGEVQYGVTDTTGKFLQNGVKITLPNGTVLYGYMDGQDFISEDGTTIVLQNGTVLTGTLDQTTGIFAANNGQYYFIGNNGIETATKQSDGSYLLQDGSTIMTAQAWSVDLPALYDAIGKVSAQRTVIAGVFKNIQLSFSLIESYWQSPASLSFVEATTNFNSVALQFMSVLDEMIDRMNTSYLNYLATETANTLNLH